VEGKDGESRVRAGFMTHLGVRVSVAVRFQRENFSCEHTTNSKAAQDSAQFRPPAHGREDGGLRRLGHARGVHRDSGRARSGSFSPRTIIGREYTTSELAAAGADIVHTLNRARHAEARRDFVKSHSDVD